MGIGISKLKRSPKEQSECARCPTGFMCPEEGMHVPRICPPGRVCEFSGKSGRRSFDFYFLKADFKE